MHPDIKEFYEITESLRGFQAEQAKFGTFPLPTENTLLAAELLCRAFIENGVPKNLGAICIVELRTAYGMTFVVTASGGGNIPDPAINELQSSLQDAIGNTYCRISCITFDTAAIFYSPAHIDTQNYVQSSFTPPKATPDLNDLDTAIQDIKNLPKSFFGMNPSNEVIGGNYNLAALPIRRLLGCAVALRCDLFQSPLQSAARQRIQNFCNWADRHPYPDRAQLATNVDALCIPGGNPHQYMYRDNPNIQISAQNPIQKHVTNAWQCADSSRYCAEPKAFNLIKTRNISGSLSGQLAMWWDGRPNRFCTPNLEGSAYTNFMLPCTSCNARSAQMIGGIAGYVQPHVAQDEPLITLPSTATRLRRGSI